MNGRRTIWLLLAVLGVIASGFLVYQYFGTHAGRPGPAITNAVASLNRTNTKAATTRAATNLVTKDITATTAAKPPTNTTVSLSRTNLPGTNTVPASFQDRVVSQVQAWSSQSWFLPVAIGIPVILGLLLFSLSKRKGSAAAKEGDKLTLGTRGSSRRAAVSQCNVYDCTGDPGHLWMFNARGKNFALARDLTTPVSESLPSRIAEKDWRSLVQPKLNIAWLPSDQVFLRVVHLPQASLNETLSMIEFQLEKLSPMTVAQAAWSVHPLPQSEIGTQSMVLLIVARSVVEEFLGKLERNGYLADRLDLPIVGQLQTMSAERNGAYVLPGAVGGPDSAVVAWFYEKVLRSLDIVQMPPHEQKAASVREQLTQMTWSGELDGWLTSPPAWHLVADSAAAQQWQPVLNEALQAEVELRAPPPSTELAALTAARGARSGPESNLVPAEFVTRYQQQFVDRLWMRALAAVVGLYIAGVAIYFLIVQIASFRTDSVENQVTGLAPAYTNAMQLKAQYTVLKDRQELKFAALDCWKAVAESLPSGINMQNLTFRDGKRLSLQGTAPMGQVQQIYAFEGALRRATINEQPLFDAVKGESVTYSTAQGGASINWSFTLELNRSETP